MAVPTFTPVSGRVNLYNQLRGVKQIRDVYGQLLEKTKEITPFYTVLSKYAGGVRTVDSNVFEHFDTAVLNPDFRATVAERSGVGNVDVVVTPSTATDLNAVVVGDMITIDHPDAGALVGHVSSKAATTFTVKYFNASEDLTTTNNYGTAWPAAWDTGAAIPNVHCHMQGNAWETGSRSPDTFYGTDLQHKNVLQIFKVAKQIDETSKQMQYYASLKGDGRSRLQMEALRQFRFKMELAYMFNSQWYAGEDTEGKRISVTKGVLGYVTTNRGHYPGALTEFALWDLIEPLIRDYDGNEKTIFTTWAVISKLQRILKDRVVNIDDARKKYHPANSMLETPWGDYPLVRVKHLENRRIDLGGAEGIVENSRGMAMFVLDMPYIHPVQLRNRAPRLEENIQENDADLEKFQYLAEGGVEVMKEYCSGIFTLDRTAF